MDLKTHAIRELKIAGAGEEHIAYKHVMALIDKLIEVAPLTEGDYKSLVGMFFQIANFEVLNPLTGADDEWDQISPHLWQNNRCPRVFKELGVGVYDSQATVFIDEKDNRFTRQPQSRGEVRFPYTPVTRYVRVKKGPELILPPGVKH